MRRLTPLVALLSPALCVPALAQCEVQRLLPASPAEYESFGSALAVDGELALVGAIQGDQQPGVAHVYRRGPLGWVLEDTLQAPDGG